MWPEDCLAKSSDGSCYSAQIVNQVLHKSRFRFRTNPNQIFWEIVHQGEMMFCNGLGPTWLSSVMSAPSRVWAAQLPNHSEDRLELLLRLFTGEQTFSPLCVCASVIGSSQILQSFVMQMPGCLVCHTTAAQTIWINLFFYVSHTGTTVAACRWAASSRSWVYAEEQLHFFTSAITSFSRNPFLVVFQKYK